MTIAQLLPSAAPAGTPIPIATRTPHALPFPECPRPATGLVLIAVDPAARLDMRTAQEFIIALKATESAGYRWQLRPLPVAFARGTSTLLPATIEFVRELSVADTAFTNADHPGGPPMVGGAATQYFVFNARSVGTQALTFDLRGPTGAPASTRTFTVSVRPNVVIC